MKNDALIADYLSRSKKRLKAIETLYKEEAWADVVRESQEVTELSLKAVLRSWSIDVPRIHDVSDILEKNSHHLGAKDKALVQELAEISRQLRRDRELAFYGSEDLTPSDFYRETDAKKAKAAAEKVVKSAFDLCS